MELDTKAISRYLSFLIKGIPADYETQEINLNNIAYFCINGLAVIGQLDKVIKPELKQKIIDWVYSQQVEPPLYGGFRHSGAHYTPNHTVEESHIAMTYSSIAILLLLGDDLSRVNVPRVMEFVKSLQLPNGSFKGHHLGSEDDVRFVFCAAFLTKVFGTEKEIDVEKSIEYLLDCQTYEGGFAHQPGDEAHGGATYCAIAALDLWDALDRIRDKKMLAYWLSQRQDDGFNGRTHKLTDTCYSFWIGSPLKVLGWYDDIVDKERLIAFIMSNYKEDSGMFRPNLQSDPDIIHTHFSLLGLSMAGFPGMEEIDPALGFCKKGLPERITKRKGWGNNA
ncbi:geranylgeranyl transferase type-1 subunit beta-like protein [Histomonas meleagridis]|uniref:geranylgeranyl transferase type-1 subunit beta-like protein n=1 Tax=Histomonas meleagridis TaxID=135588 RepID=UPI00355A3C21|nr:geranylgeranyl transferase type-1 subunit beta-like protein [Histomonas meleagridis]KAH0805883.1 geranylgeranyl transferase type-1 subunit beta-like protein [Histomonas meleagridis]